MSPVFRVSACIRIAMHGRNEPKPAVILSVSLRKRWATAAARCTKRMREALSSLVPLDEYESASAENVIRLPLDRPKAMENQQAPTVLSG
jgi:hypothetical protein